jgi:hypothetical protein
MSSGETLNAAIEGRLDLAVAFLPPDYAGPSVGEIPCQLVLSGPKRPSKSDLTAGQINLATYGPTCPYRLTTLKYLTEMNIPFKHTLEASSPAGLTELISGLSANAPFPLMLRRRRYLGASYLDGLYLPAVRLGLVATSLQFRKVNHARLTRILTNLRAAVIKSETENRVDDALPGSPAMA